MGDWLELSQSVFIAVIFAFMVAKLISIVLSFRDENLRITRTPEYAEPAEICETVRSTGESREITWQQIEKEGETDEYEAEILGKEDEKPEKEDEILGKVHETLGKEAKTLRKETGTLGKEHETLQKDDETQGKSVETLGGKGLDEEDDDWEGVESTELDEAFGAAASYVATMAGQSERIPNDVQLQFYGLYKLATEGPCTVPQPSALKITSRAKWHAWQRLGTMSPEAAMQKYITLLSEIRPSWADGMTKKSRKQDEESSNQSAAKGGIGPVFSTFVSYEGSDDETRLEIIHSYASEGDVTGLLQVLEQGVHVDLKDSQGRTALHWAADRGQLEIADILGKRGADVNAKDMEGQTPLHYAFVCEREDIARYLIDHGADASIEDNDGDTPLGICPKKWSWMYDNA